GVAGAGMGPLACLMRARGHEVQGSDRAFDLGKKQEIAAPLRRLGIELARHDGTAVTSAIDRFVYSAAVEDDTPELRAAPAIGIIHNVSRDHDELAALRPQFTAFARNCGRLLVGADCPEAAALGRRFKAATYGELADADARLRVTSVGPRRARGVLRHEGR